ncbi:MAG: tRNA 2-thiouridine(34) synthase MnmA [Lachnospiraceae bacterium]|nr:tRNA 2-thiouridine(34) synthase MnmA [Lachnospiraceae bacterium]
MEKVVVGLSGGVDSAVTAYLLKQMGCEVTGVTLCMHEGAKKEAEDAKTAAECIGIAHRSVDLRGRFQEKIIRYFTESYKQGETPNPCIVCNPEMKWNALLCEADALGAKRVATGHYAGVVRLENGRFAIRCAASAAKDQAYVLYGLTQEQLARTVMPLAAYEKQEVRKLAADIGLLVAEKADSMEVCFLPEKETYTDYIIRTEGSRPSRGNFVDENGNILGTHQGLIYYTVGQRKGLGIAFGEPRYVKELRPAENEVVLSGNDALWSDTIYARDFKGMAIEYPEDGMRFLAKIRYSHKGAMCTVYREKEGLRCVFDEPQRAATPGQAVVFYREESFADTENAVRTVHHGSVQALKGDEAAGSIRDSKGYVVAGGAVITREGGNKI